MIIHLLGVPMDLGSGRRGVDMGPSAIRIAGVAGRLEELGHKVVDEGDVVIKNASWASITFPCCWAAIIRLRSAPSQGRSGERGAGRSSESRQRREEAAEGDRPAGDVRVSISSDCHLV